MPGMKVTETFEPVSIKKLGNKYILDIGQNMAVWVCFRIKGQTGDSIRLRYVEGSGYPNVKAEDFVAEVVEDEMEHTGTFNCFDETLKGPRIPLCVAVSEDGINWQPVLTLEDSPISQYSYPGIIQGKDGKQYAIYTWRRQRIKYAETDPAKF